MAQERGSEALKKLAGNRHRFDEAALKRVGEIADKQQSKILDWWIYGQPAIDRIFGTLRSDTKSAGALVERLLADEVRWNIRLFPYGIPWPEEVIVQIEHGPSGY